jgi:hypothetical protein
VATPFQRSRDGWLDVVGVHAAKQLMLWKSANETIWGTLQVPGLHGVGDRSINEYASDGITIMLSDPKSVSGWR